MFKSIKERKSFPEMEDEIIKFWKDNRIFERSVEERPEENSFVFYDGPPFISGLPHYGHLLGSIAKDLIPRYQTMKGKRVERVWGWDAHGLTVENKVQKKLGIKNRREIERYGLEKFTKECYNYTSEISSEWKWYIDKIARWVDFENAYKTMDMTYMESVIWAFKQLYDKGLIYEGVRTSLYCPTCGTPVSNFEIAMDNSYKDMKDPAVTIKFRVLGGEFEGAYILAWTTTPWTLPSNRALVVDKNEEYVLIEVEGERLILVSKRLSHVIDKDYKEISKFKGEKLLNLSYEPLYKVVKPNENEFKVYHYEGMVHMEEGTGIVHSAPGFGEIDTQMGNHFGLNIMLLLDDEGKFQPANKSGLVEWEQNPYLGKFYKDTDPEIIEDLKKRNLLYKHETIVHRFPYHDRCDTPLVYKAQNSWFINIEALREDMIKNNENINWVPEHLKEGRFKKGIEQAPDWCISRSRFWATPMPVWQSEDGERLVVGSIKEIEELSGQKVKDLHRPFIDEIVLRKNGKEYRRIPEVLDCWMESGSMSFAQLHYPFENKSKFKDHYPGDYIVEYIAQTRAWFYVMHVMSTALFGSNSFKNCVTTGVMAGNDGRKMSKTYGNYTDPKELLEKVGGDALRLYLMGSPLMVGENANFDEEEIKNKSKNILFPLWNSLKFFLIYAELHDWNVNSKRTSDNPLDRWILARTYQTLDAFSNNLDKYQIPAAVRPIEDFIQDLSTWYVRRSRDRFANGDKQALSTLYEVLMLTAKGLAPIIPFMAESIYQRLKTKNDKDSVHLEFYPKILKDKGDDRLLENMKFVREIVKLGQAARVQSRIKVRQPLGLLEVKNESTTQILEEWMATLIKDELNVKDVKLVDDLSNGLVMQGEKTGIMIGLDTVISDKLRDEGLLRELQRAIQNARKKSGLNIGDKAVLVYETKDRLREFIERNETKLKQSTNLEKIVFGKNDGITYKINDIEIRLNFTKEK